jgi:hypothetical protein
MKRNLANLKTALRCTFFILATGAISALFMSCKDTPRVSEQGGEQGLEIFAFAGPGQSGDVTR